MSLVSQIQALAARIGAEDKTQNERLDLLETSLGDVNGNKAPLASPALTGTPTAPTAPPGTDSTQIATTAFVLANAPSSSGFSTTFMLMGA